MKIRHTLRGSLAHLLVHGLLAERLLKSARHGLQRRAAARLHRG